MFCYVQVATLRAEPFALQLGDRVNVIVRAQNTYGWGEFSQWNLNDDELPTRIQISPQYWPAIELSIEASTLTSLYLKWSAPSEISLVVGSDEAYFLATGGAEIYSNQLQMLDNDSVEESWIILTGETDYFNQTEFDVTGLQPNTYYTFRVRSLNEHGWSAQWNDLYTEVVKEWDSSTYFQTITAIRPEQPSSVTTSLVNLHLRVKWVHPADNFQVIDRYEIQVKSQTSGDYFSNKFYCDGDLFTFEKSDAQLYCDWPVKALLIQEPFNYGFNQLVVARVRA
jgi:hypothetical protein